MFHQRNWYITECESAKHAAALIKNRNNECFGLRVGGLLFLNDSTDTGFQEYAVISEKKGVQVDSWTMDWMSVRLLEQEIQQALTSHETMAKFTTYTDFQSDMIVNRPLN